MPELRVFVRNPDLDGVNRQNLNRMQLVEDEGGPKVASANWTSQSANQSHYFADNFRVHALAQSHRPFETVRKGRKDEKFILKSAASAVIRAVAMQEKVEWLFP